MASNYYFGQAPNEALGDSPRYFYAMRRNIDGELYFLRSDQLIDKGSYDINNPGSAGGNWDFFESGIDYVDGLDSEHNVANENLKYPQYRWDDRSILYYVDDDGFLVQRINFNYDYPENISSDDNPVTSTGSTQQGVDTQGGGDY